MTSQAFWSRQVEAACQIGLRDRRGGALLRSGPGEGPPPVQCRLGFLGRRRPARLLGSLPATHASRRLHPLSNPQRHRSVRPSPTSRSRIPRSPFLQRSRLPAASLDHHPRRRRHISQPIRGQLLRRPRPERHPPCACRQQQPLTRRRRTLPPLSTRSASVRSDRGYKGKQKVWCRMPARPCDCVAWTGWAESRYMRVSLDHLVCLVSIGPTGKRGGSDGAGLSRTIG